MSLLPAVEAEDACVVESTIPSCSVCVENYYLSCGSCNECSTTCSSDKYRTSVCTATSDMVCTLCTRCITLQNWETTSCQENNDITQNRVCSPCSTCSSENYRTALCTTTSNTQCTTCTTCTSTQYAVTECQASENPDQNRVCADCQECKTGETYEVLPCNATSDRSCDACTTCDTGSYQESPCTLL